VKQHGGGVMIEEDEKPPKVFGFVMLPETQNAEDLAFVARKEPQTGAP
jgi:hypothetical protein